MERIISWVSMVTSMEISYDLCFYFIFIPCVKEVEEGKIDVSV